MLNDLSPLYPGSSSKCFDFPNWKQTFLWSQPWSRKTTEGKASWSLHGGSQRAVVQWICIGSCMSKSKKTRVYILCIYINTVYTSKFTIWGNHIFGCIWNFLMYTLSKMPEIFPSTGHHWTTASLSYSRWDNISARATLRHPLSTWVAVFLGRRFQQGFQRLCYGIWGTWKRMSWRPFSRAPEEATRRQGWDSGAKMTISSPRIWLM